MKHMSAIFLALVVFVVSLLPNSALAASTTITGTGPTMTQSGVEYSQFLAQGNPGAVRTITTVSWQQSFDRGYLSSPMCPGLPTCVLYPQPMPMAVYLCYNSVSCIRIDNQPSGTTSAWSGQKWIDYALFTFYWQPQENGGGPLIPIAKGKTNRVTINYN